MAPEVEVEGEEKLAQNRRQEERGGVRIVLSASVVAAVISALTTVVTNRGTGADSDRIAERIRADVMKEASQIFVAKGVDDTRWTYYTQAVEERLRAIAAQLTAIEQRTAELPRIAAKLEMYERSSGK